MTTPAVWIAEKPSAAADLAAGLCLAYGTKSKRDGALIRLDSGDVIVPLAGHCMQTVPPAHYLAPEMAELERQRAFDSYGKFMPILPPNLSRVPREDRDPKGKSKGLFGPYLTAKKVLKGAKLIVNAGDIDREGQLIVDELLEDFGIDPYGPNVKRFGLASNLPEDIAAAVKAGLGNNGDPDWRLKRLAAETRQRLDWVWGMNLSMVGQACHRNSRVSAGRVQTPVLWMVDERCKAIESFKPTTYFVPVITLADGTKMRWSSREGSQGAPGFDLEGRIVDELLAQQIVASIKAGLAGRCTKAVVTQHSSKPPLPFSLSSLQAQGAKELGLTLEEVGEAAKELYQKHKAISYIGTDCKFLPTSMHAQGPKLLRALSAVFPKHANGANHKLVSPAFNDSKLDEHFAIVPTGELPHGASQEAMGVFRIVARRFIAQFHPDYVYRQHKVEGLFGQDLFVATARQDVQLGWKEVEGQVDEQGAGEGGDAPAERDKDQPEDDVREIG